MTRARGDGVGIEVARDVIRGVRLSSTVPGRLVAATEVPVAVRSDDRSMVDALVRLRAELGDPEIPTRLAVFPPGSTLARVDATGLNGPELNQLRSELALSRSASSTVLTDDGPRRWLMGLTWNDAEIRRLEDLAERAGFVDIAVDPSPLALARVLGSDLTHVRRDASPDQSFGALSCDGVVIAAAALDPIGRMAPALTCSDAPVSPGWFDDVTEPAELVAEIARLLDEAPPVACGLDLATSRYPEHPPHDLRSPQRQCVALGAAVGAAGLAGRLRPVDIVLPAVTNSDIGEHPWAIERVSNLPSSTEPPSLGAAKRFVAKLLPRRR